MINLQEKYDPLYVPLDIIPEGYEYAWIREDNLHCGGWSPVPFGRKGHERFVGAHPYRRGYSNEFGYIQVESESDRALPLFLCESPKSVRDLEKRHEEAEIEKINAMPGIEIAENIGKEIFGEDFRIHVVNETTWLMHQIKE